MQINSNFSANTQNTNQLQQSLERIASGKRINNASDDAAGNAIATRFNTAAQQDTVAIRNASDGVSFSQTADALLGQQTESIQRLRELALQSSNPTLSDRDRSSLQAEFGQLQQEIRDVNERANYNGNSILNEDNTLEFQIGSQSGDAISIESVNLNQQLEDGGFFDLDLSSQQGAQEALGVLDSSFENINQVRSDFGANANRFESAISSLEQSRVNNEESRSRVEDADIASEISDFIRAQVQDQADIALQRQANSSRGAVLQLLQGI